MTQPHITNPVGVEIFQHVSEFSLGLADNQKLRQHLSELLPYGIGFL